MKILAIDTSNKEIGVAIAVNGRVIYEGYFPGERKYNRALIFRIEEALLKTKLKIKDIDIFASTLGPGSFTGIRVGISTMKAFAEATGGKFSGIGTLDILAETGGVKNAFPGIDAGRGEIYIIKRRGSYAITTPDGFVKDIKEAKVPVILEYDNFMVELSEKNSKIEFVRRKHIDVGVFALMVDKEPEKHIFKDDVIPVAYIRKPDAVINLKKKRVLK